MRSLDDDKRASDGPKLAQQLQQVLDRDPRFDVASLSTRPEGEDAATASRADRELVDTFNVDGKPQQLLLERATLRSGLQVWLFAPESIGLIPKLAAISSSSPIEKYLPPQLVNWKLMDTSLWRWIAMVLLALVLAAVSRWISRLAIVHRRTAGEADAARVRQQGSAFFRRSLPVDYSGGDVPRQPFRRWGFPRCCGLPGTCGRIPPDCRHRVAVHARIVDAFIAGLHAMLVARKGSFPYSTLSLISRILKLAILVFAFAALLGDWGYNTSTILAGLGVGGIAIALAAQKTIENLFGGVAVISDRPVKVGDYCKFGTGSGHGRGYRAAIHPDSHRQSHAGDGSQRSVLRHDAEEFQPGRTKLCFTSR